MTKIVLSDNDALMSEAALLCMGVATNLKLASVAKSEGAMCSHGSFMEAARDNANRYLVAQDMIVKRGLLPSYILYLSDTTSYLPKLKRISFYVNGVMGYSVNDFINKSENYHE